MSRALDVVFVHPTLGLGGAERFVVDSVAQLRLRGHSARIVTCAHAPDHAFPETTDGRAPVTVHARAIPAELGGHLRAPLAHVRVAAAAWLGRAAGPTPDVVVSDLVTSAIPVARATGSRVLFYCHYPDLLLAPRAGVWRPAYRRPIDAWERATISLADALAVNSAYTAEAFRRAYPRLATRPIHVVHPGVDASRYAGIAARPPTAEPFRVLTLSRFSRDKHVRVAIEAFARLRPLLPATDFARAELVIAGGFDAADPECTRAAGSFESAARAAGLERQVRFVRSPSETRRLELLAEASCVLHPTVEEHFGYVPVEAMAAGRAVVASNRGGPRETVIDGETGRLVPPEADAFARTLAELAREPEALRRLGGAGPSHVARRLSLAASAERLEALLRATADAPPRGRRP